MDYSVRNSVLRMFIIKIKVKHEKKIGCKCNNIDSDSISKFLVVSTIQIKYNKNNIFYDNKHL